MQQSVTGTIILPGTEVASVEFPAAVFLMLDDDVIASTYTDAQGAYDLGTNTTSSNNHIVTLTKTGDWGALEPFTASGGYEADILVSATGTIAGDIALTGAYASHTDGATVNVIGLPMISTQASQTLHANLTSVTSSNDYTIDYIPAGDWDIEFKLVNVVETETANVSVVSNGFTAINTVNFN
jgi:hypothetical protein